MSATNVEELICVLETFDAEQSVSIGERRGKHCLLVGLEQTAISLPANIRL